jgi:hypothetical protein
LDRRLGGFPSVITKISRGRDRVVPVFKYHTMKTYGEMAI